MLNMFGFRQYFAKLCTVHGAESSKVSRCIRDLPPAHYMMKIQSYSLLAESEVKYDSGLFETGGHKWKLSLYPKGLKKSDKNGHISLYLTIAETDTYPPNWEVFVNFKFFIYDQIQDNYLTIQDAYGTVNRFYEIKKERGFSNLISLETFNNPLHGYLVNDCCVFGAEVCVINPSQKCDSFFMVKERVNYIFPWKLEKFSTLHNNMYESEVFTTGERKWTLRVYPKGNTNPNGLWLSVYLNLVDGQGILPISAHFKLHLVDIVRKEKREKESEYCFGAGSDWGFAKFMELKNLNQFIVNDTLSIAVQFLTLNEVKVVSSIPYSHNQGK